jgi:MFS family permease
VIGLAGFAGRLLVGTISDRLGRLPTLGLSLVLQPLSFAGFTVSHEIGILYSAAAVFGISYGGIMALFPALIGDFFGRLAIGEIVGVIFSIAASALAFGPLIAGILHRDAHLPGGFRTWGGAESRRRDITVSAQEAGAAHRRTSLGHLRYGNAAGNLSLPI